MAELYEKLEKLLGIKVEQRLQELYFSQSHCASHGKYLKESVLELIQGFDDRFEAVNQRKLLIESCEKEVRALNSQYSTETNRALMQYEDILAKTCIFYTRENGLLLSTEALRNTQRELIEHQLLEINAKDDLDDSKQTLSNLIETKENLIQENEELDKNLENFECFIQVHSSEIQEFSAGFDEVKLKVQEFGDRKKELGVDIGEHEKGLERLRIDCEELRKEIGCCEGGWEKKSEKCGICARPELGRMKKCKGCLVVVHAKCTKELKFMCANCKNCK